MPSALLDDLVQRGLADWVTYGEAEAAIESNLGIGETDTLGLVLSVFKRVLELRLMEFGEVSEDGFHNWGLDMTGTLDRIRDRRVHLDHVPWPGDVCWLANTPEGNERAIRSRQN